MQFHDRQAVVVNPPALPLSQEEMDRIYDLPYTRRPHPSYTEPIPAYEMIKDSVTIMRGCFGGCTFCSITAHQGRIIQSRSQESVLKEVRKMAADPEFSGVVSDIGGPTANMYQMRCTRPEVEAKCKRLSCVHPTICKLLGTDHGPLIELMQPARTEPGIRKVLVASGIRMDLAQLSPEYMRELAAHHVGGHLKVAPEHTDPHVLELMKKPDNDNFEGFAEEFKKASTDGRQAEAVPRALLHRQPSRLDLHAMIDLAVFLKRNGYRPDQVQDFIPAPFDIATCMYYTGIDPFTKQEVYVARNLRDRKMQRALMQFFKPENYFEVREALIQAGRHDLIGNGCDCLIPAQPPKEAIEARQAAGERGGPRRPLPHRGQPGEGRASRRAGPAESGLPTGAEDSTPSGQEAQTERRRFKPATVANCRPPSYISASRQRIEGSAHTRPHSVGRSDRRSQRRKPNCPRCVGLTRTPFAHYLDEVVFVSVIPIMHMRTRLRLRESPWPPTFSCIAWSRSPTTPSSSGFPTTSWL